MESPAYRRVERACVGLYALVAVGSLLGYLWLVNAPAPATGEPRPAGSGAFAVVGLFWLCVLAAVAMVVCLLTINAVRLRRGEGADRVVVASALAVPTALAAALVTVFYGPVLRLSLGFAAVALVVAPAVLLVALFGGRVRERIGTSV